MSTKEFLDNLSTAKKRRDKKLKEIRVAHGGISPLFWRNENIKSDIKQALGVPTTFQGVTLIPDNTIAPNLVRLVFDGDNSQDFRLS